MRIKLSVVVAVTCASLLFAASASAAITASTVTVSPPAGTYVLNDDVATGGTGTQITGTGTSQGGMAGDPIVINCYAAGAGPWQVASTTVGAGGSFSFTGTLQQAAGHTCVLRAVNQGDPTNYAPGTGWPYTGPTLAVDERDDELVSGGPNSGALESYELFGSQLEGGFSYQSAGHCTIAASEVYDPVTLATAPALDTCDGGFSWENGQSGATRSEIQVDGNDAYLPGDIQSLSGNETGDPGFPSLTYSYSLDPATGNVTIEETDQLVACSPGGAYPPSSANCSALVPTGVQLAQQITQYDDGRVATVVQYFSSTDGRSHSVDLLEDERFSHPFDDGELDFPWTASGMQPYTVVPQTLAGPGRSGPGSFLVEGSASVVDGQEGAAQGSVTFSNSPSSVDIVGATDGSSPQDWVELHYTLAVPAAGSVPLGFTYSDAFSSSEVDGYAATAQAAFTPQVSITSPANGAQALKGAVSVSGTAADATGLSIVTVDGRSVPVAANGGWSTTVSLRPGANTIAATAINVFGDIATARATVTLNPAALAPRLSGLTQAHPVWREHGPRARGLAPVHTSFGFTLSRAARVTFQFTQPGAGYRFRHRCVVMRRPKRGARRCALTVAVATMSVQGHAGHDVVSFSGLVHDRELAPGRYTLVLIAATGELVSKPRQISFAIVG